MLVGYARVSTLDQKLDRQIDQLEKYGIDIFLCPKCKKGNLELIEIVFPCIRGSPSSFENQKNDNASKSAASKI